LRLVDLGSKSRVSTDDSIPTKAVVRFDSGIWLLVDERMNREKVD